MRALKDLTGQQFGRLAVICLTTKRTKCKKVIWLCRCNCGNLVEVIGNNLNRGTTKSCGCLQEERIRQALVTHGDSPRTGKARLYNIWKNMNQRCFNPNGSGYKHYGGRKISICQAWRTNYSVFRWWAILNGYTDNLTIDRINNDGNYTPDNCRWVTLAENIRKSNLERKRESSFE